MLVGAFDNATKLFGRGYVTLVAGNSANVALSDFGRVIKTTQIKVLPESVTQKPAYSFKGYTKDGIVQHLTEVKIHPGFNSCSQYFKLYFMYIIKCMRMYLFIFRKNLILSQHIKLVQKELFFQ